MPDRFNEALNPRKAIYRLYPQAIPGSFGIERPPEVAVQGHLPGQGERARLRCAHPPGKFAEALAVILERNPLPMICGRVCNHPCEEACLRGQIDEPVAIDALERYVADNYLDQVPLPKVADRGPSRWRSSVQGRGPDGRL